MTTVRDHIHQGARRPMTKVRVSAPARLHLGMLDVAGGTSRRFGGVGLAVMSPAFVVEATPAAELSAEGPEAARALASARRCTDELGLQGGAHIRVLEAIPPHVGLGSGTKLGLAVAQALGQLHGLVMSATDIARAAGRGARSAVGLWTFLLGGLVVEAGVRPGSDAPSPLLARHAMPPEWRCVLVVPNCRPGLSGPAEEEAFRTLRPPRDLAALISQLVLTSLLPALVERDLMEFGATLTRLQQLVGKAFASVQGGTYHPQSGALVEALLSFGAAGAGQTSWGPATYGFVGSELEANELAARMQRLLDGRGSVKTVAFDNSGAKSEMWCAC